MNKIHIVNLSNYVSPVVVEMQSKEWVTYGKNNSYFQYLIDRSRGSATNGAVCQSIVDLIYGDGLTATNKAIKTDEWAQFKGIFGDEDVRRAVNDLKRMGQCAFQIQYQGKHKSIKSAEHIPVENLAPEKLDDDEDEVQAYYYARNWNKIYGKNKPERIPAFGTSKEGLEILYIKPYRSGLFYFSNVDYQGGLQYAELEEEIGNYHINNIQNAFAPSMMVNFNNGVPPPEVQEETVRKIRQKFEGSTNAGKVIIAFNDNKENAGTIEPVALSDAPQQYQFLSDESITKILVSHRVTSPLLLGISTNTGFGSNADELKTASLLFESLVINPFRQLLIEGINKVLAFNKISLNLEFESLNPFDDSKQEIAEGLKLYDETPSWKWEDGDMFDALNQFGEEEDLKEWELIDEREVDYELEDKLDAELGLKTELVSTGTARPNSKSEQDGEGNSGSKYKVRYQYNPLTISNNSRPFCKMMVNAKKIYRKEDIIMMGEQPINAGWGAGGASTYSIWKYKGGGGCHHRWYRKTYKQREGAKNVDVRNPNAQTVTTGEARSDGFRPPANEQQVPVAPKDMPGRGFLDGRK